MLCVVLIIISSHYHLLETTLNPPPPTLEVYPGENTTLSCIENGTSYITWNWNDFIMRQYIAGLDNNNTNATDPLFSDNNMMVSTRLISLDSSHVHSQLEFTLFENATSVKVSCNQVMLLVKNRGKVHYFILLLYWCFIYNFGKR